jgi:hypothetical protein
LDTRFKELSDITESEKGPYEGAFLVVHLGAWEAVDMLKIQAYNPQKLQKPLFIVWYTHLQ